jgi:hypothetical protein
MSKFSQILSWCSILTYLLLFPLQVSGAVLCVGEDGHIAVEHTSSASSCCPRENTYQSFHANHELFPQVFSEECGACFDHPLTTQSAFGNSKTENEDISPNLQPTPDASSVLPPSPTWREVRRPPYSFRSQEHPEIAHLRSLHSIVILS